MRKINVKNFSSEYFVRPLTHNDVGLIYNLCQQNNQFYEYSGKQLSMELIEQDLSVTPPGIPLQQKYYIGFFDGENMVAVMDLIDGYPDSNYAYIGFFMVRKELQGKGVGTRIFSQVAEHLRCQRFEKCRLGIDKNNPQSKHFWRKNGFEVVKEVETDGGIVLVAEKNLK